MTKRVQLIAAQPYKVALLAVGGDGGSVLTNWVTALAETNGYWCQATSIAGVAQRTGATVYYMELIPLAEITVNKKLMTPVLAQMPAPADVDVLLATELMEAGRALAREFISKKTTAIFSSHRNLAIKEKEKPGDGIVNSEKILKMVNKHAKTCLYGNFKFIADKNNSVISATLLGALAASETLPFKKASFIKVIKKSGITVPANLAAFEEAFEYIKTFKHQPKPFQSELKQAELKSIPKYSKHKKWNLLIQDIKVRFPLELHDIVYCGAKHLADWQNINWAKEYLKKLTVFLEREKKHPKQQFQLSEQLARYLAIAMSYDDLVYVADMKTRRERFVEMYAQVNAKENDLVTTTDYLHPSFKEFCGFLPAKLGQRAAANKTMEKSFTKYFDRDRRMKSTGILGFTLLYIMGGMKSWRLKTLRHFKEMQLMTEWLANITEAMKVNYQLAVQITKTYRLKKGYGSTSERGESKFHLINVYALKNKKQKNIAQTIDFLIAFALQNHQTKALKNKIQEL